MTQSWSITVKSVNLTLETEANTVGTAIDAWTCLTITVNG